jgi:hypothetical protein
MRTLALSATAILALAVASGPGRTLEAWLGDAELRATFGGVALDGHYASGRTFSERYGSDGRLEYREQQRLTRGRWSVEAGTFCTIYDQDPTGGCFRVKKVGANCYEFYFVARSEEQARRDPNAPAWTARAWDAAKPASCAEGANV